MLFLSLLSLLIGCTEDPGGGVTNDPQPPPIINPPPVITPVLNLFLSELKVKDISNNIITNGQVNQQLKLILTARDQFGSLMKGLTNIKMGLKLTPGFIDLTPTEISDGVYQIDISLANQGFFSGYFKYNGQEQLLYFDFNISYCNGPADPLASPFHNKTNLFSKQFYIICSPTQLASISLSNTYLNYNFVLGNNIDLSTYYIDLNSDQIPDNQFKIGNEINEYNGHFFGNNFTIKNFKYKNIPENNIGLFGSISDNSIIESLILDSFEINGNNNIGTLVGSAISNSDSIIIDSIFIFNGSIKGFGSKIGGLAGNVENNGSGNINIENSSIFITQNLNGATKAQSEIGGLIGYNFGGTIKNNSVFSNFTYTDKLFSMTHIGGLIGYDNGGIIESTGISSNQTYSSGDHLGCLIGYSLNSLITNMYLGINCTINQLGSLPNDILYSGGLFGEIDTSIISGVNGSSIVSNISNSFGGFSNKISGSNIDHSSISGSITGNLNLYLGGFAGDLLNSSLTRVSSYVSIDISNSGQFIGGLAGKSSNNTLSIVSNYGQINAQNISISGGLIGQATGNLTMTNAFNSGQISSDSTIGGIIGKLSDNSLKNISNVYNSGTLRSNSITGGLIGSYDGNNSSINNSFSIGEIKNYINGVPTQSGSIIGEFVSSPISFSNIYFLSEATNFLSSCGSGNCSAINSGSIDTNSVNSLSIDKLYYSSQINPPLNSWDFLTIWGVYNPVLPFFK